MRVLALLLLVGCGSAAPSMISAASAKPVPVLEYRLLAGGRWSSSDVAGRIVVLDVWATWCKPCKKAFPKLDRLAADHPEIVVIGISVDDDDAVVREFLVEVPASFTIARDPEFSVRQPPLSFAQLPSLVVLDRHGRMRVRAEHVNEDDYDKLSGWVAALKAEP